MIPEKLKNLLQEAGVGAPVIDFLAEKTTIKNVKASSLLVERGKVCDEIYFIISGGFVCRYYDENAHDGKAVYFYLEDLHPLMSCVDSYFTGLITSCELKAIRKSQVAVFKKKDLEAFLGEDEEYSKFYHGSTVQAFLEENLFRLKLISNSSENFYHYLRECYPEIIRSVPSRYIAEFMGISPEWLVKLKKRSPDTL